MPGEGVERSKDLERFITFVDAIVAIAITLLVLPLVDIAGEVGEGQSVRDVVHDNGYAFVSFFLSFIVIARLWQAQHHVVRRLTDLTGPVTTTLLLWCLTIVFLPFPTALIGRVGSDATAKVLYMGTLTISSAALAFLTWSIVRNPAIRDAGPPPRVQPGVLTSATFLVALAISLAWPATSYYPLLLLLLTGPLDRFLQRRRG